MKPIKVFYSELSERFYASRAYTYKEVDGQRLYTITGQKFDVTDDIGHVIHTHNIEFRPKK